MTYEKAYKMISEFCFTGYKDNKKPTGELFSAIHELVCKVEENTKLKAEIEQLKEEVLANENWSDVVERTLKKEIDKNEMLKSELEQSVKFPLTNADKIRSMSVEEMARILFTLPHEEIQSVKTSNRQGIDLLDVVNWLNSESEVE